MEIQRCNVWWIQRRDWNFPAKLYSFCLVIKETWPCVSYPDGRLCISCWLILDTSSRVLLLVGLTGSSSCWNRSFGFPEGAHNRGLPSNPTIHTTSPLDEDQSLVWLVVVHFACPMISCLPHYCKLSTFHCPSQFIFKMEHFLWLSREPCAEIQSRSTPNSHLT